MQGPTKRQCIEASSRRVRPRLEDSLSSSSSSDCSSPKKSVDIQILSDAMPCNVCYHCKKTYADIPRNISIYNESLLPLTLLRFEKEDPRRVVSEKYKHRMPVMLTKEEQESLDVDEIPVIAEVCLRAHCTLRYCRDKAACIGRKGAGPQALLLLCFLQDFIKD